MTDASITMPERNRTHMRKLANFVPYVGMFALALLLWLPFSFKTTGTLEELSVTDQLEQGNNLFFITPTSNMALNRPRPLQWSIVALSYALDPNSFLYYNVFQMLFFFGKMVAVYWLMLEFLPGKKVLAFFTGVLFAIYPGDTGLFTFRIIHIHCATLAYLLAFYLLIQYWKRRGERSWLALVGMAFLLLYSVWQYQIAMPMALVTPFFLLYFTRPNRRFLIGAGLWYSVLAAVLFYAFWVSKLSSIQTYEGGIVDTMEPAAETVRNMVSALLLGYQRQIAGWSLAVGKLDYLSLFGMFVLAGIVICAAVGWWLVKQQRREIVIQPVMPWWRFGLLLGAGIVLFAVGLAIYLPFPTLRFQDFRIYILAMIGSALVLALLLYIISRLAGRFGEFVFILLALPFVGLALVNAFAQHQYYVNFSLVQQSVMQQVIAQAPQFKQDSEIVLIDQTGELHKDYVFFYGDYFQIALRYVYGDRNLRAYYCLPNRITARGTRCDFENDAVLISENLLPKAPQSAPIRLPYDHTLIFATEYDGSVKLLTDEDAATLFNTTTYHPQALITGSTPPFRAKTLFSCEPALSCYRDEPVTPSTTYDLPDTGNIGLGWRGPEIYDVDNSVYRWSITPTSTVDLGLSDTTDLVLEFKILAWLDEATVNSLKVTIHGQDIPFTFTPIVTGGRLYHAIIPRSMLIGYPARTRLLFTIDKLVPVPDHPDVLLGISLNGLSIRPA